MSEIEAALPWPAFPAHDHVVAEEIPTTWRFLFFDGFLLDVTAHSESIARSEAVARYGKEHGSIAATTNRQAVAVPTPEEPW